MTFVKIAVVLAAMAAIVAAQPTTTTPRFEDYPVKEIFKGAPAVPILVTAEQRRFRTCIREGVAKGYGVFRDDKEQPGPNFAGHYIVVAWGCGSPCGMLAIVDAITGKVYNPPISDGFKLPPLPASVPSDPDTFIPWVAEVDFRLNSRLMIVKANPDPSKGRTNYTHYFLWDNNRWKLLLRMPLKSNDPESRQ